MVLFFCGSSTKYNVIIVLVVINIIIMMLCVCIYKNITECYYIIIKYHQW